MIEPQRSLSGVKRAVTARVDVPARTVPSSLPENTSRRAQPSLNRYQNHPAACQRDGTGSVSQESGSASAGSPAQRYKKNETGGGLYSRACPHEACKPVTEIALGIETEFLAEGRTDETRHQNGLEFISSMAHLHNFARPDAKMESQVRYGDNVTSRPPRHFNSWVVEEVHELKDEEDTSAARKSHIVVSALISTDGIEIQTPQLRTFQMPNWRAEIRKTWVFLEKNYLLSANRHCSTHVHVSVRRGGEGGIGMGLCNMKKIAQSIIHFEPALEAAVPPERRGNVWASSNWIDNNVFADPKMTRLRVLEALGSCTSVVQVAQMMSPGPQGKAWAWNFQALNKFGTIEFRKGSASLNSADAIGWAELVLHFVLAAVKLRGVKCLLRYPANIGGLKNFLGPASRKMPMFAGKSGDESIQPQLLFSPDEKREMLERKLFVEELYQAQLNAERMANG